MSHSVKEVDGGRKCVCVEAEGTWEFSKLSAQFLGKPKTLKNKDCFKKNSKMD